MQMRPRPVGGAASGTWARWDQVGMAVIFLFSCCFFPIFFLTLRWALQRPRALGMDQLQAVYVAAKLVSSVQAVMASTAGYIVFSSCKHVIDDQHWLAGAYTQFAVPYFVYDIYAMFLCHWHKYRVKGHEGVGPRSLRTVARAYLRKEFLMVLHHLCMVLVCFPISVYKRQHTLLHKVNGLLMLVTFFCCRILLFPYMYWAYGRHAGLPLLRVPLAIPPSYNLGAGLLLAPQLYWFGLICRGAFRLFRRTHATGAPLHNGHGPGGQALD
ncbi:ceramide synthase isoform X5 [Pelodiscus sinensis]|uniref:ceramide synthase isoform X5 n=1 Tax=Pelodiscus sinensis TaxID=13735 RepID=UPI003F6A996A